VARLVAIAPGVLVATSRRDRTTSTVAIFEAAAGGSPPVLIVDPAWDSDELADLGAEVAERGLVASAALATHAHYDHLLWHPSLGDAPRFASEETARRGRDDRAELLAGLGPDWPVSLVDTFGRVVAVTGPTLPWEGPEVELIVHDAHIPGHTAAWVPALGLLIAGDMLSDLELPLPEAASEAESRDPLAAYREGLERLAPYVVRATVVIPGHGAPTDDGRARLDADRRYLDAVVEGRRVDDSRLDHPGMAEAHRTTVALAG
jgi:glyoxylase-like metal-dependent hydrolase (beta-lactamase superfamily II)